MFQEGNVQVDAGPMIVVVVVVGEPSGLEGAQDC